MSLFGAKSLAKSLAESLGSDPMHDSRRDSLRDSFFTREASSINTLNNDKNVVNIFIR